MVANQRLSVDFHPIFREYIYLFYIVRYHGRASMTLPLMKPFVTYLDSSFGFGPPTKFEKRPDGMSDGRDERNEERGQPSGQGEESHITDTCLRRALYTRDLIKNDGVTPNCTDFSPARVRRYVRVAYYSTHNDAVINRQH
jgi:hypothetical protein